jgi:hypothetical protein
MAKLYAKRIKDGKMTINEVPERWRAQVEELLK